MASFAEELGTLIQGFLESQGLTVSPGLLRLSREYLAEELRINPVRFVMSGDAFRLKEALLMVLDGSNQRDVELFLESISGTLDSRQIRVYRSSLSGRDRLGVIYGDYPSREAATAELAKLARSSLGSNPYVRSINKIR
jgi:hypothetical protein